MSEQPIPMLLWCPVCGSRHTDIGEYAIRPHATHACQICGNVWRPAIVPTVGVPFLPGFRNEAPTPVGCVCTRFDDGSIFRLMSFSGGAHPNGAFSEVTCQRIVNDRVETIRYVRRDE